MNKLILFFLILSSFTAHSAEFTIGVEKLDYLPFYTTQNKQYQGYARELFDRFGQDNGHNIHYKVLPVARLLFELLNEKIDFKFPDNPNWKSLEKQPYPIQYSASVVQFTDGIMVKPESLTGSQTQFSKIGTMRGFTPWVLQAKINQNKMFIVENNTFSGLLQQAQLKRIDGAFINIDVARYYLKNYLKQPGALLFNSDLPHDKGHYYLSSIKHPEILKQFNQWLEAHQTFHQELKQKWGL